MVGAFMLLTLAPAAPVPKALPPEPVVEVTAKPYAYPPEWVIGAAGLPELYGVDDGHFLEVTVRNVSKETLYVPYTRKLRERVRVSVTNSKGEDVSDHKRHIGFRRAQDLPKTHELKPGASFTVIVHLEDNWPDEADRRTPGQYKLRAIFEAGNTHAESTTTFNREITN